MAEVVTFEQIVHRVCGLDIHKQTVVGTICSKVTTSAI